MARVLPLLLALGGGCAPAPAPAPGPGPGPAAAKGPPASSADPAAASGGGLMVINGQDHGVEIYEPLIVDARGKHLAARLWPDESCPDGERHMLPGGGRVLLPPPTMVYEEGTCEDKRLLEAGAYVVKLDSGQGAELYATAPIELPMRGVVELTFETHAGQAWTCDEAKARRVGALALALGKSPARLRQTLPKGFFAGCDAARARCVDQGYAADVPLPVCTITVREGLVRIDRPPGDDAPRGLRAWVDREGVVLQLPDATRTSASRVEVGGKAVVLAGVTEMAFHEHGGDPAHLSSMRVEVDNDTGRALAYRVTGIEFMTDAECNWPQDVRAHPKVMGSSPTTLPPGRTTLTVGFAPQDAYQSHCDRFATRATVEIEGRSARVTSEHEVTREEPAPPL